MVNYGTYLSHLLGGLDAERPTAQAISAGVGFYFASDTGALYARPASSLSWVQVGGGAVVEAQPNILDIVTAPSQNDFNGLLAALRAAGVLKVA